MEPKNQETINGFYKAFKAYNEHKFYGKVDIDDFIYNYFNNYLYKKDDYVELCVGYFLKIIQIIKQLNDKLDCNKFVCIDFSDILLIDYQTYNRNVDISNVRISCNSLGKIDTHKKQLMNYFEDYFSDVNNISIYSIKSHENIKGTID